MKNLVISIFIGILLLIIGFSFGSRVYIKKLHQSIQYIDSLSVLSNDRMDIIHHPSGYNFNGVWINDTLKFIPSYKLGFYIK